MSSFYSLSVFQNCWLLFAFLFSFFSFSDSVLSLSSVDCSARVGFAWPCLGFLWHFKLSKTLHHFRFEKNSSNRDGNSNIGIDFRNRSDSDVRFRNIWNYLWKTNFPFKKIVKPARQDRLVKSFESPFEIGRICNANG